MNELILVVLVFATVMALAFVGLAMVGAAGGRRLRQRLDALSDDAEATESAGMIRSRYLRQLSPVERRLEQLPGMERLGQLSEQSGRVGPAYRVAALSLGLTVGTALLVGLLSRNPALTLVATLVAGAAPFLRLLMNRSKRLEAFETQLPDALELMSRSLRAGNPLLESFKFVGEEMKPPIAAEFMRTWSNINYGVSLKASLMDLLDRIPSVSLRSLATAILVQRETGGNLAEILDKITGVLRARARFQRRLRALTAEGKMSGWILGSLPPFLALVLSVTSPNYLPVLFGDPTGRKMVAGSLIMMAIGAFWISRIVRIRV